MTQENAQVKTPREKNDGTPGESERGAAGAAAAGLSRPPARRPRLSERALPRLHFVDGRCRVLLHDVETGDVVEIGPREWILIAGADGTRDLDGILAAASREGVQVSREALEGLLQGVDEAGLLAHGVAPRKPRGGDAEKVASAATAGAEVASAATADTPSAADAASAASAAPLAKIERARRPIERLAGYTFHCTGHGSCCRLYATVVFSPLEAARARSLRPEVLDGGDRQEHAFMPERGPGPCAGAAVALVNGGCAYLDGSQCSLHRVGGPGAKPLGCNLFPLALVDDGTRVRASVSVECACVLASVGGSGGDPILPESVQVRGDLDPAVVVDELPDVVEIVGRARAPIGDYVRWCDAVLAALPASADAARLAWALAGAVEAHGFDVERALAVMADPPPLDAALAARFVEALADKAARRAKAQNAWRSEKDLCRRGVAIIAAVGSLLADAELLSAVTLGAGARAADETFYLRVALFGHSLVGYPIALGLRDRAVAMWIARMFPLAAEALHPGEDEPAFAHPLALVEALLRGHGLRRYTDTLADADVAPGT